LRLKHIPFPLQTLRRTSQGFFFYKFLQNPYQEAVNYGSPLGSQLGCSFLLQRRNRRYYLFHSWLLLKVELRRLNHPLPNESSDDLPSG